MIGSSFTHGPSPGRTIVSATIAISKYPDRKSRCDCPISCQAQIIYRKVRGDRRDKASIKLAMDLIENQLSQSVILPEVDSTDFSAFSVV
jgi:hypothetical protein